MQLRVAAAVLFVCAAACGGPSSSGRPGTSPAGAGAPLRDVTLPALSAADESVQAQVNARYADMRATLERGTATDVEKAQAYGRLGMVLHASGYYEAAEPGYLNAQALDPRELRWPYLLALLRESTGDGDGAVAAYQDALHLHPDDVPSLVGLGQLHLERGDAELAEPLLARARQVAPTTVAALVGLGQVALARQEYGSAIAVLEEALAIDPQADSIHAPLAMAYRGLGQVREAERHLAEWRNTEIPLRDPLRQELERSIDSGLSFEQRGVRALEQRNFPAAVTFFEQGVTRTSADTSLGRSLRHKLGTALYMTGDVPGALQRFREVLRAAPADGHDEAAANAHYSVGLLMATAGRDAEAIGHLSAAVRYSPAYFEAFQLLGDALRRAGRDEEALVPYATAIEIDPRAAEPRFGYGMALVRLGRYREARDWFEQAARLMPERREFPLALARLLAAAPDAAVRDGGHARRLVDDVATAQRTTDVGETLAMALAEQGHFNEAASVQRAVMDSSRRAGFTDDLPRMAAQLQRYERGLPSRTPWAAGDPVFSPGPAVVPELRASLPASIP